VISSPDAVANFCHTRLAFAGPGFKRATRLDVGRAGHASDKLVFEPGFGRSASDHAVGIGAVQFRQLAGLAGRQSEEGYCRHRGSTRGQTSIEKLFELVMLGDWLWCHPSRAAAPSNAYPCRHPATLTRADIQQRLPVPTYCAIEFSCEDASTGQKISPMW
jgi:hypothetical protein